MRKLYLGLMIMMLVLTGCNKSQAIGGEVQDINGNVMQLADYRGKWIVVNYWASWCEPCAKEIPQLNNFYQTHEKHDAIVLGVNYDGLSPANLHALATKMNIKYPILIGDPKVILGIQHVPGLPATYLISPKGKLVKSLFGEQTQASLEKAMGL